MFLRILLLLSMSGMSYCHQSPGWEALVEKSVRAGNFEALYKALDLFPQDVGQLQELVARLREEGGIQVEGERHSRLYDLAEKLQQVAKRQ